MSDVPARHHQKAHHPMEDIVNTARGSMPQADADLMDEGVGHVRRHRKTSFSSDDDAAALEPEPAAKPWKRNQVPPGFEGGWRSLMKNKPPKKKHKFQDQTNGIMDLVQTPTTYTAWHPDSTDAVLKASAKSQLKAAERAFDAPDGEFFLQLRSDTARAVSSESTAVSVAQLLLEQYAGTLGSATLLQLSRSDLNLAGLKSLWRQISSVNTSVAHGEHEAQTIKWCQDFQLQSVQMRSKKRATARQAASELAKTQTQSLVYGQEAKAQERFLSAVERDVQGLRKLLGQLVHQFDSTTEVIQNMKQEIARTASADPSQMTKLFALQEAVGKVEGLVSSGSAETIDMIKAAAARRERSAKMWQNNLAMVQESLSDVEKQQAQLSEEREAEAESTDQEDGLRDRYQQMCKWTLDDFHARQRQEECEKSAIQAALVVLSSP
jgi:hypothetical protein